ncbi:MarR family transcriptional regulator [Fictibacillus nanhaiensis]|uniref:MarR family winged helix-turn-helix transcriptional regulator n=1 Tax=Fictibacillus nanhaiensis TaxID=742169 RepID=UPI002E1F790E|nr:MarR family transcriptional regulator [Fictibacillus nanhaiensis]
MKKEPIDLFVLYKLVESIKGAITEGEKLGIKQIDTLLVLLKHQNMSITEIAHKMNVSPPSVSALTDKLIKKELIKRTYNHLDRRVVTVSLTESGRLLARELQQKQHTIISTIEDPLTKEEIHTFNNLLNKLNGS